MAIQATLARADTNSHHNFLFLIFFVAGWLEESAFPFEIFLLHTPLAHRNSTRLLQSFLKFQNQNMGLKKFESLPKEAVPLTRHCDVKLVLDTPKGMF